METTTFSYLVRSMSDSNHMGGIWSQESLDTSTCGMGTDSKDMVSEVKSTDSGVPTGYRELDGVGAETISLQSERIPDSPCLVIWGLTWGLGRWVVRLGHCTQKLLPVIYIFKLLAESIVYQWGVIWQCLVLIPNPHACVTGLVICGFLIWMGEISYMSFLNWWWVVNINSLSPFHNQICPFSTTMC